MKGQAAGRRVRCLLTSANSYYVLSRRILEKSEKTCGFPATTLFPPPLAASTQKAALWHSNCPTCARRAFLLRLCPSSSKYLQQKGNNMGAMKLIGVGFLGLLFILPAQADTIYNVNGTGTITGNDNCNGPC